MDSKRSELIAALFALLILIGIAAYARQDLRLDRFFKPTASNLEKGRQANDSREIKIVARDLAVPWEIVFLPSGDMLVTERPGTLKRIGKNQQSYNINGVKHVGEGGLLGLTLHPDFEENGWIYLYLTTQRGDGLTNRVERYTYKSDRLSQRKLIIGNIPGAANHDGGRLAFGPDRLLYITTGDAGQSELAQNIGSLAGKILRLNDEGEVPEGNPYANAVYSYGHRNPQGLAWDDQARLWATEHGRSGIRSGLDELNLIRPGANYGWPEIEGSQTRAGMQRPASHSGEDETWAPSGMTYANGSLFFAGLRGQSLYEARLTGNSVSLKRHFTEDYGRLRAVVNGPDGKIYFSTSNTDGRGNPDDMDDQIISVSPGFFR